VLTGLHMKQYPVIRNICQYLLFQAHITSYADTVSDSLDRAAHATCPYIFIISYSSGISVVSKLAEESRQYTITYETCATVKNFIVACFYFLKVSWKAWRKLDRRMWIGSICRDRWRLVGSFYDAFSVIRLYSIDVRVASEWWIGKDLVGSGRGLIQRYYSGIRLEGLSTTTQNLNQDSRSPGPRFETGASRIRSTTFCDRWRALVNTYCTFWSHKRREWRLVART
jgi:hypothetical protein